MAQPDHEATPQFSQPVRQITLMLLALALCVFGGFLALPRVLPVFQANPYLNGFIVFVFVIGVVACFYQVIQLIGSVRWIESFAADRGVPDDRPPQLLAPLAALLRTRGARMQVSASSTRSILDSVSTRIDEAREITRYIVNMLIFLGLLGTFYGLATTVPAIVDTIRSLSPQEGEGGTDVFNRLMTGLESQLAGMGVAFASSLLGLAGSLIVGLLELFAGHGQNRFYQELEDWLSSITRVGFTAGEDSSPEQAVMAAMVDHMSQQMEELQTMHLRSEEGRGEVEARLAALAASLDRMTVQMGDQAQGTDALDRIAEGQERMIAAIEAQGTMPAEGSGNGPDAESRMRLRSIDVQMLRVLEEISAGRQETMAELRHELSILAKALSPPREPRRLRVPPKDEREG
ncbi:biopolymer transporter ExbB [Sulfitobacter albidus]|uniref:Biopolymer transporter ExbB n=1 Tax=Sulfitobacter albidus TaxID=2829501 RepID=A0A975JBR0_9RHOB|nr:biopolymer transporter ExbB [Sulfitobacter albidus]QUJ75547.1 biopolymer transporter ExbB [Sulfitobacter albidus]